MSRYTDPKDGTDARIKANRKYMEKAYDRKLVYFPAGMMEQIKALADADGVSVNRYILEAVEARSGLNLTLDGEFPPKK